MSFADAAAAIRRRFSQEFDACPVAYPNAPFDKPDDSPWVRLTIRGGEAQQVAVGAKRIRRPGIVFVQVFAPSGDGDGEALGIAEQVAEVYETMTVDGIRLRAASIEPDGVDDHGWYMVIVRVPFQFDGP